MNECRQQRIEQSDRRKADARQIDDDRACEVLPDNAARASRDLERIDQSNQVVAEQHHVGALLRHVCT